MNIFFLKNKIYLFRLLNPDTELQSPEEKTEMLKKLMELLEGKK